MDNKNYTFIYQNRSYNVIFSSKTNISNDIKNYITKLIQDEYKNCELVNKTDKNFKVNVHNKNNFNNFKKFLIDIIKKTNQHFKINIVFNIDINNIQIANIYTILSIDKSNDDKLIEEKINQYKEMFINNLCVSLPNYTNDVIDGFIYSSMYNTYYNKLIFTIHIDLYEQLVKLIYNDKYFNKNNLSNFDTYDLYSFEYLNETSTFKEYLTICKNCKEYHKSFYTNDKSKCKFICAKCNYVSDTETFKDHICNVNKILDYCHICYYYYKITKKHMPNRGDCFNYVQLIKKFINENRSIAIKNITKTFNNIVENVTEIKTPPALLQTYKSVLKKNIEDIIKEHDNIISYTKTDNINKFIFNIPENETEIYEITINRNGKSMVINI